MGIVKDVAGTAGMLAGIPQEVGEGIGEAAEDFHEEVLAPMANEALEAGGAIIKGAMEAGQDVMEGIMDLFG